MYERQGVRCSGISRSCYPSLKSMVLLASKHGLDPKVLADAFFDALENKISYCGSLKISCRKVKKDSAIFLITKDDNVAGQFPIDLDIITDAGVRDSIRGIPLPEKTRNFSELGRNLTIGELRPGMRGVNTVAEITEIPPTQQITTKWGSEALVSQVKIADKTGSVRLSLWNDQIKMVNVGDEIEVKNCHVTSFANETQVRLGRRSTMSIINQIQEQLVQHPSITPSLEIVLT